MAADLHKNFAYSLLTSAPTSGTGLLTVTSGESTGFPTVPFNATIWPAGTIPKNSNAEIVRVTSVSTGTDTLTITRAQEGTTARAFSIGDQIAATITKKSLNDVEIPLAVGRKVGSLTFIGHSWLAGSTQTDSGTPNVYQEAVAAKIQGMLGVHEDNVLNLGQAGSTFIASNNFLGTLFGGWGGVLQFVMPSNSAPINAAADVLVSDPSIAVGGASVIVHGCNDITNTMNPKTNSAANDLQRATNNNRAAKHAYRTTLSRIRAGVVYCHTMSNGVPTQDSNYIGYAGSPGIWDIDRLLNGIAGIINTGAAYRRNPTTGAFFDCKIPENFTGGTVAVCLIGSTNGVSHTTADMTSGQLTVPVFDEEQFPQSGTIICKIDNEEMLVTGGLGSATWNVATRGINATTAASHTSGSIITMATDSAWVSWSAGTAPGSTGMANTYISGQGSSRNYIPVTTRFTLTSADAGKYIRGTFNKASTSDTSQLVIFDSWWIETADPPPTVICNLPDFNWPLLVIGNGINDPQIKGEQYVTAYNAMLTEVKSEFDEWVQIADAYTPFYNRNGRLVNTITTASTTCDFSAYSSSFTPQVGQSMTFGTYFPEVVFVTSAALTTGTTGWSLGISRAKMTGAGLLPTTAQVHTAGDWMGSQNWMHSDQIHPNVKGHSVLAQVILDAFDAMPLPTQYQMAQNQGAWSQQSQSISLGVLDNSYLYPSVISVSTSSAMTTGIVYSHPIYIPKISAITEIGVAIVASGSGTLRFGMYLPNGSHTAPGRLLQDFGTISATPNGDGRVQTAYQLCRPGWYWLAVVAQAASGPTVRAITTYGVMTPGGQISTSVLGATGMIGYSMSGVSGALPDWSGTTQVTTNAVVPRIFIKLRALQHA